MSEADKKHNWYWRSLSEVDQTPEFEQFLHREFPEAASEFPKGVSRRRWLQLMGASMALGAAGCRYEQESIAPFARRPQNRVPGETRQFTSLLELSGVGYPCRVTSYDGRPIKVDGNPDHPDMNGASTLHMQSCVLDLYDPDRSRGVKVAGSEGMNESSWAAFGEVVTDWLTDPQNAGGKGIAILSQASSSPTRIAQKKAVQAKYPEIQWFEYDPLGSQVSTPGTDILFGQALRQVLRLEQAEVIVSLDADPLGAEAGGLRNARGWAAGRDVDGEKICNRVYAVESHFSTTGMVADHRLPLKSTQIAGFVASLEAEVNARLEQPGGGEVDSSLSKREKLLAAMAQDLVAKRGKGAVVCGFKQSPKIRAMVHRLNVALGNVSADGPVSYVEIASTADATTGDLAAFVNAANSGELRAAIVIEGNPVFDAPVDLAFAEAYGKVANRVHLGLYEDETSLASTWHLNQAHALESWGDARSFDGSWCVGQPQIEPIWEGRTAIELLGWIAAGEEVSGADLVRSTAVAAASQLSDPTAWKKLVHDGYLKGSEATPVEVAVQDVELVEAVDSWKVDDKEADIAELELVLSPSGSLFDGRFANNGWLQECPDFATKVTWDNVALFAPSTAEALAVKQNTLVSLTVGDQTLELPAHIQPGQARGSIGVSLGYGRPEAGAVGGSVSREVPVVGVDLYPFLKSDQGMVVTGLTVTATDQPYRLAVTQDHHAIDETGLKEINHRVGELIRVGQWSDLQEMQEDFDAWEAKHSAHHGGSHGGDDHSDEDHSDEDHSDEDHSDEDHSGEDHNEESQEGDVAEGGSGTDVLPIAMLVDDEDAGSSGEEPHGEGEGHDDEHGHGSGHHVQWPYHHAHFENINLNDGPGYDGAKWGMSIDLNKCTGCNACVVACQSENNIPIVGKDQVSRGREMHWLRIDRYYTGEDYDDPEVVSQPLTCHHCENAPCEQVCPVAATVHSDEGLNDMVYNRCIGTRYCGNNCPYKVRRFNYLNYTEAVTFLKYPWADKLSKANRALKNLVMNPEVSVRSRGVMEKCTYCVQRIQNTKIRAKRENNRPIGPEEITTACQDACATEAIVFGDLANHESRVRANHQNPRSYALLGELNVRPRTKYLARVKNPHPAFAVAESDH